MKKNLLLLAIVGCMSSSQAEYLIKYPPISNINFVNQKFGYPQILSKVNGRIQDLSLDVAIGHLLFQLSTKALFLHRQQPIVNKTKPEQCKTEKKKKHPLFIEI